MIPAATIDNLPGASVPILADAPTGSRRSEPRARPERDDASVRDPKINVKQSAIDPNARRLLNKNDSSVHAASSLEAANASQFIAWPQEVAGVSVCSISGLVA